MASLSLSQVLLLLDDKAEDFITKAQNVLRNDQIYFNASSLL